MINWEKKGYMSKRHYDAACATTRKIKNKVLAGTGARYAHKEVLRVMMEKGEFDRPAVTITRKQIEKHTGFDTNTVKAAYRVLKAEGSIKAIYNALGGRGNAVVFVFQPPKVPKVTDAQADRIERIRVAREEADKVMRDFNENED